MHGAGFDEQHLGACRGVVPEYLNARYPGQMQAARSGFEHVADLITPVEFPPEHHELSVIGEKVHASVDVIGVKRQRVTGQQITNRAVVGHWAVASFRPAAAPRRNA